MPIQFEEIQGESWFKIADHNKLRPFFMSIVSDSNHWMFISSNGGLTAGRKNAEHALFPYYSDDKITDLKDTCGCLTIFRVHTNEGVRVWEPFSDKSPFQFKTSRNLYKNQWGNKVRFEEINHDLNLTFSYEWNSSNLYGFLRRAKLNNTGSGALQIEVLDGFQNLMPYGVNSDLQMKQSNLVDAYKRSELLPDSGLGIFALSAIIVDRAEPSEALKANVVWSKGLDHATYLLTSNQVKNFKKGKDLHQEEDVKGVRGAYLVSSAFKISGGTHKSWDMVANVNQTQSDVIRIDSEIQANPNLLKAVYNNVEEGTNLLKKLVGTADGLQTTNDLLRDTRHYANVMFNIMRGGIFDSDYRIERNDLQPYLKNANRSVYKNNKDFINSLPSSFDKFQLEGMLVNVGDKDLIRLCEEYLPLKFSRRHGDPSRPWNRFSINTTSEEDGSKILDYEGNWRDIFQNWEALAHSYPEFIEGMISKFLNASTFDGYNPYRVTKGGFDWEVVEPDDPWSFIGYWGDHQIIYLLKFLEFHKDYNPKKFKELFSKNHFVYANVPYRIKPYEAIVDNPKDTIDFDFELDKSLRKAVDTSGADGALLRDKDDSIHRVGFTEKILATVLTKLSNLIPEAGIWLNTQRPEWNDANNALVGNGVSMVTLYYLRRFLKFMLPVLEELEGEETEISKEQEGYFRNILNVFREHQDSLKSQITDGKRKDITDQLGRSASDFRTQVYEKAFSGEKVGVSFEEITQLFSLCLEYLEHSIKANKRRDNLYHAYNLISIGDGGMSISYLPEMLEGQVAVLSSGSLDSQEALEVLEALRQSKLYREDQNSYILYPNKDLPGFLEKNVIPAEGIEKSNLLTKMVAHSDGRLVNKDVSGDYHFSGNFRNAADLKLALENIEDTDLIDLVNSEKNTILDLFEDVFNHKAFTGRSGTFFGYEGLGSIYWHMVSKLYLAAYEVCLHAHENNAAAEIQEQLQKHFNEIGEGIGTHKDPKVYGAFPVDPYSHTPAQKGAQQPGMTGQVKEDILVRMGELGLRVSEGAIVFDPFLLDESEFLSEKAEFEYFGLDKSLKRDLLESGSLGFTFCEVPVIYVHGDNPSLQIEYSDGTAKRINGNKLKPEIAREIFRRSGKVKAIKCTIT